MTNTSQRHSLKLSNKFGEQSKLFVETAKERAKDRPNEKLSDCLDYVAKSPVRPVPA